MVCFRSIYRDGTASRRSSRGTTPVHNAWGKWTRLAFSYAVAVSAGCQAVIHTPPGTLERLLTPVSTSPESVTLEIFDARIAPSQQEQLAALWRQVDEMQLPTDTRRRLQANGFRLGVIGGSLPPEVAALFSLTEQSDGDRQEQVITEQTAAPRVRRRVVQLQAGKATQIKPTDVVDELRVLYSTDDGLTGNLYTQARGVYELQAAATAGQRVAIELSPELHHGELRNRWVGEQGMLLVKPSREREHFPDLRIAVELDPGDLLVVGTIDEAPSSLGHALHTVRSTGVAEQKLVMLRMLEVPVSEILAEK